MNTYKPKYGAILVPELLAIRTNVPKIYRFPLASRMANLNDINTELLKTKICIDFYVENFDDKAKSSGGKYFQRTGPDTIYYESPIGSFGMLRLQLCWNKHNPKLIVNPQYHRYGKISVETVHSEGRHIRDVANTALLHNGYALLHSAAISYKDKTVLLTGLSNTGKTTTVLDFVRNHGALFMGDDLVVTDGINAYACPLTRANVNPSESPSIYYTIHQNIRRAIPFVENIFGAPSLSITDFLGTKNCTTNRKITDIFILVNSAKSLTQDISRERCAQLLYASNQVEFTHNTNQVLWAAEYLQAGLSCSHAMRAEMSIIRELTERATIHYVEGNAEYFKQEIKKLLLA